MSEYNEHQNHEHHEEHHHDPYQEHHDFGSEAHQDKHQVESHNDDLNRPSAPPPSHDDNGYVVVADGQPQQQPAFEEEVGKIIDQFAAQVPKHEEVTKELTAKKSCGDAKSFSWSGCMACPYFFLGKFS